MANNSSDALNELRAFQGSRRKSQDVLRESETRLGLPSAQQRQVGLKAAITNTENLIRAVPDSVAGRTGGSLVTDAQRTRLVGLERQPHQDMFREQSRALEGETDNINALKDAALNETRLAIADDDQRENSLSGVYDMLFKREQLDEDRRRAAAEAARWDAMFRQQQEQAASDVQMTEQEKKIAKAKENAAAAQPTGMTPSQAKLMNQALNAGDKLGNFVLNHNPVAYTTNPIALPQQVFSGVKSTAPKLKDFLKNRFF